MDKAPPKAVLSSTLKQSRHSDRTCGRCTRPRVAANVRHQSAFVHCVADACFPCDGMDESLRIIVIAPPSSLAASRPLFLSISDGVFLLNPSLWTLTRREKPSRPRPSMASPRLAPTRPRCGSKRRPKSALGRPMCVPACVSVTVPSLGWLVHHAKFCGPARNVHSSCR